MKLTIMGRIYSLLWLLDNALLLMLLTCIVAQVSATKPLASLHGDPHFQGADGIPFHFSGQPDASYCLLSDPSLHINVQMGGFYEGIEDRSEQGVRTWVKAIGVLSGIHRLELYARTGGDFSRGAANPSFVENISLNGVQSSIAIGNMLITDDGQLRLEHAGITTEREKDDDVEVETLKLVVGGKSEFLLKIRPEISTERKEDDAFVHFSVEVMNADILSHEPHGILGQTFRSGQKERTFNLQMRWNSELDLWQVAGDNGEGYLDGNFKDYSVSGLLGNDCKYSRFNVDSSSSDKYDVKLDSSKHQAKERGMNSVADASLSVFTPAFESDTVRRPKHISARRMGPDP